MGNVDKLAALVSSGDIEQFFGVSVLTDSTGKEQDLQCMTCFRVTDTLEINPSAWNKNCSFNIQIRF